MEGAEIQLDHQLTQLFLKGGGLQDVRPQLLQTLKQYYSARKLQIDDRVLASPNHCAILRYEYAQLTDDLLKSIFDICYREYFKGALPSKGERVALVAVGGYGRNEMAPFSDIDILFLVPHKMNARIENLVEATLYVLWDMGLKVGQSVRSISECVAQARSDITIRTSLLELRHVSGDAELVDELQEELRQKLFNNTVSEFIEAKLEERKNRHNRSGNTRYVLEPNVKEAKGGLRDLQTLYWIGKYITGVETPEALMKRGFYLVEELDNFREAEDFLWKVRILLHSLSKRGNDILSFDIQVELARVLSYHDTESRRGVEYFMQDYFRAARMVGELTRVFLTELEAQHLRSSRLRIGDFIRSNLQLPEGFHFENKRVNFDNEDVLINEPLNYLRIFLIGLEHDRLIHPNAFRYMARHHELINDEFRGTPEVNQMFMSLLLDFQNPERVLRRMNELGILGVFIPQWANIDAMMQYNMYHSYTVDEHTIRCVSILSDIEKGLLEEELPVASGILEEGVNRPVLYLALLLHDIGKGQVRPHEVVGEEIAREVAPRFGLSTSEIDLVAWLVRFHLEMSDAAQKRDLSDPKTIADFAELVGNKERLDLLTILTVCDIRGVGPTTWNNWKAMLLRELHALTSKALTQDGAVDSIAAQEEQAVRALRSRLKDWPEAELDREVTRHYPEYWIGLPTDVHIEIAEILKEEIGDTPKIKFATDEDRGATRVTFAMPDHPGLFARICGAISLSGANIVDARTYTSSDGIATAVFWVQDHQGNCYAPSRQEVLKRNTLKILHGEIIARRVLSQKSKIKKRERAFRVATKVKFDNEGSRLFTIIEIETRDRIGLLHDITRSLAAANIYISSAIVATYGEEAVDSFYVKDLFGLKITSASKQKAIEEKIRFAIEQGYQEALQ